MTKETNDLNKQYFETKKKHKEGQKKLTRKDYVRNIILTILLLFISKSLLKKCHDRIDRNDKIKEIKTE
jgi:hypothetical protein